MFLERPVHEDVRALLLSNEPFQVAHLIKFERPSRPDVISGKVSTSAHNYAYLTDASRDVVFDDGSINHLGTANGPQTYIANKVLNVSNVQEATEAKANNFTVTLGGNGIGAAMPAQNVTITSVGSGVYDLAIADINTDLTYLGFREGDKVFVNTPTVDGSAVITHFRANNTIRIKAHPGVTFTAGLQLVSLELDSEEIKSILLNKNSTDYASFINREVYIYRAYFQNGILVGSTPDANGNYGPILLFKGIISNVAFDDEDQGIKIQWGLTSHWGDFSQVRGRITSDEFHRALDHNGIPQPDSAIKMAYAYDKGFMHAETSINLLSVYTVLVEKQDIKVKRGFLGTGLFGKVKVKKTMVPEDRNTNLDFQLAAKSIPLIYGVRNTTGMPVFADTLKNDSSEVYVVYALCEGQIGGLYDLYISGKSLICNNEADFDARSKQNSENTIDVVCRGRADRGDVLNGIGSTGPIEEARDYYFDPERDVDFRFVWNHAFNRNSLTRYLPYVPPTTTTSVDNQGRGVIHGQSITLTEPQQITLDFFSGTEWQQAASQLVEIAEAGNFKVQNDYWTGRESSEYWGPNHRLLDTAYIVGKYKIKEGDTTIPEIEYIIKGKVVNCYNYDYSYTHDDKTSGESAANFPLGSTVSLYNASNNALLNSNVQIIDKWTITRPDGVVETRFRFSSPPNLGYVEGIPSITKFYMQSGGNRWTMTTFNHVLFSGTLTDEVSTTVSSTGTENGGLTITYPSSSNIPVGGDGVNPSPLYSIYDNGNIQHNNAIFVGEVTSTKLTTRFEAGYIE